MFQLQKMQIKYKTTEYEKDSLIIFFLISWFELTMPRASISESPSLYVIFKGCWKV